MVDRELLYREHGALRDELQNLKDCQVRFLTYSVTATGLLLGIGAKSSSPQLTAASALAPLVILLPAWWVFFDKATTITRIVGYYRILERAILNPGTIGRFIGWENALDEFRREQHKRMEQQKCSEQKDGECNHESNEGGGTWGRVWQLLRLRTSHPYWVLIWSVFFSLSSLCLVLYPFIARPPIIPWLVLYAFFALCLLGLSAWWNGRLVWRLIWGRHSYTANEKLWEDILRALPREEAELHAGVPIRRRVNHPL